ncbi:MAG: adenosylmethionine--8-amino-7-oxononanoate transaminase [Elusimicrobiota bacterium]|jgi:adenosylmethionine-8-amino-7-oxononanoate aminotransferase|nr:adenosylmethionine--8-amino-7-oxononanoate transaminase [Elusimicrobiota bacterium]
MKKMSYIEKDFKYIWHPYTQMKDCEKYPNILLERAKGIKLYDDKGNFYYDIISSWWCNVHGHNHPKIKNAIKNQLNSLDHIMFAGFTHKSAIKLAEKLINVLDDKAITKIFFSDNGSTSVEVAIKMSMQYWYQKGKKNKKQFLCLDYGYHGDTIGTMSVSGIGFFNQKFSSLFYKVHRAKSPYCYRCPFKKKQESCIFECVKDMEQILIKNSKNIAGIILEPLVMGAGGMIIYPKEYLEKVGELAQKYNVHLILDEVATGFGRTGKIFAYKYTNIKPDFICISKGLTGGILPLAATFTTEKIYQAFYDDYEKLKTFYHGHTFTANPLSCASANASLEIFDEENYFEDEKKLKTISKILKYRLKSLKNNKIFKFIGDVRSIGMIGAIELVRDKKTKKSFEIKDRIGMKIYNEALKENLIMRPIGNIIYFYLPLCTSKRDLNKIFDKTEKVLFKIEKDI